MEVLVGSVVRSTAGRDKGDDFIVLSADGGYVYLADGRKRKVEAPKKKKLKHIQASAKISDTVAQKAVSEDAVTNSDVRKALAELVGTN